MCQLKIEISIDIIPGNNRALSFYLRLRFTLHSQFSPKANPILPSFPYQVLPTILREKETFPRKKPRFFEFSLCTPCSTISFHVPIVMFPLSLCHVGYYISLSRNSVQRAGDRAFYASQEIKGSSEAKCLSFWYYMYEPIVDNTGPNLGKLAVWTKSYDRYARNV